MEGENLQELFLKFADAGEQWNQETFEEDLKKIKSTGKRVKVYSLKDILSKRAKVYSLKDILSKSIFLKGHPE